VATLLRKPPCSAQELSRFEFFLTGSNFNGVLMKQLRSSLRYSSTVVIALLVSLSCFLSTVEVDGAMLRSYKKYSSKSSGRSSNKSSKSSSRAYSRYGKSAKGKTKYVSYRGKKGKRYARYRSRVRHYSCNTSTGRQQAFAFLQSSRELASLASLEYRPDPNVQQYIDNDAGEITDEELDNVEAEMEGDGTDDDFANNPTALHKAWLAYIRTVDSSESASLREESTIAGMIDKRDVMSQVLAWIGTPYWYGGVQRSGVDCSAFTRAVYRVAGDLELPRIAAMQSTVGEHVRTMEDLRFGDLIFFNTRPSVYVSHVGLYLGGNLFAHASSRYGVTVSSLQANYYQTHFLGGKRLRSIDIQMLSNARSVSSLVGAGRRPSAAAE
jgi:cell wall-associated NlpC family hydrolase